MGSRAVAGMGMASVSHHVAMSSPTPATTRPSGVSPDATFPVATKTGHFVPLGRVLVRALLVPHDAGDVASSHRSARRGYGSGFRSHGS
jgi:hypothetical protein